MKHNNEPNEIRKLNTKKCYIIHALYASKISTVKFKKYN